jgi:cell fate (sporulation/competence/biofilm development) regulator YlbF (YheA/YmcA/DUF963 family)
MQLTNIYRLRVETCIGTIIDVHKIINNNKKNQGLLSQFEDLKQAVKDLDMSLVHEEDVRRVEQATNALLEEFRTIFEEGGLGPIYNLQMN